MCSDGQLFDGLVFLGSADADVEIIVRASEIEAVEPVMNDGPDGKPLCVGCKVHMRSGKTHAVLETQDEMFNVLRFGTYMAPPEEDVETVEADSLARHGLPPAKA